MANLLKLLKKITPKSSLGKTVAGTTLGGLLGGGLAEMEKATGFYDNDKIKDVASLTGFGGGALAGLLFSNPKFRKSTPLKTVAFADTASLLGPKQIALQAIDTAQNTSDAIKDYTEIQNELADKNTEISENQLDTAIANKEIADKANEMSEKWLNLSKVALPTAGGLGALLTALYAYDTLKDKKQDIVVNLENKSGDRNKGSMYIEVPASKVSDKFYNQFSRELLFKDDQEKYLALKAKEKDGMNLTSKEKNYLKKFEKNASATSKAISYLDDVKNTAMDPLVKQQLKLRRGEQALKNITDSYLNNQRHMKKVKDNLNKLNKKDPYYYNEDYFDTTKRLFRQNRLPDYYNAQAAYLDKGQFGLTKALKDSPYYQHLTDAEKAQFFKYIEDKNTPTWTKILNSLLPLVQSLGVVPKS
jgi:hypothetical protein